MKLISINIRGLGGDIKSKYLFTRKKSVCCVCRRLS